MHRGGAGSDEGGPGADDEQARRVMGATGYLDDVALIGEPHVVAAGLAAFRTAVAQRGWSVNLSKTVLGVGYYTNDDREKEAQILG